jgi:hypothetical protein
LVRLVSFLLLRDKLVAMEVQQVLAHQHSHLQPLSFLVAVAVLEHHHKVVEQSLTTATQQYLQQLVAAQQ